MQIDPGPARLPYQPLRTKVRPISCLDSRYVTSVRERAFFCDVSLLTTKLIKFLLGGVFTHRYNGLPERTSFIPDHHLGPWAARASVGRRASSMTRHSQLSEVSAVILPWRASCWKKYLLANNPLRLGLCFELVH